MLSLKGDGRLLTAQETWRRAGQRSAGMRGTPTGSEADFAARRNQKRHSQGRIHDTH